MLAGNRNLPAKKSSDFAITRAFQAQQIPRSQICRLLFLRRNSYAFKWPTLKALWARICSRDRFDAASPKLFYRVDKHLSDV
jgi:hypothetical protein